ncbi:MAG: hypothetical protein RLY70_1339 [Planctomycetota bacterium]
MSPKFLHRSLDLSSRSKTINVPISFSCLSVPLWLRERIRPGTLWNAASRPLAVGQDGKRARHFSIPSDRSSRQTKRSVPGTDSVSADGWQLETNPPVHQAVSGRCRSVARCERIGHYQGITDWPGRRSRPNSSFAGRPRFDAAIAAPARSRGEHPGLVSSGRRPSPVARFATAIGPD